MSGYGSGYGGGQYGQQQQGQGYGVSQQQVVGLGRGGEVRGGASLMHRALLAHTSYARMLAVDRI